MRRIRTLLSAALVGALGVATAACGVLADNSAATIEGRTVTVESVQELLRDDAFTELVLGQRSEDEELGRIGGDQFRTVLAFQLEREAWLLEAERWGVDVDVAAARTQLDSQLAGQGSDWSDAARTAYAEYSAAQQAVGARFADLDPTNDSDLRRLYDSGDPLWDQICVAIAFVPAESLEDTEAALDAGATVEELVDEIEGAQLAADPEQQCVAAYQLPVDLFAAIDAAPLGATSDPVSIRMATGTENVYVFRVDERRTVSFEDARSDLEGIAASLIQQGAQPWISLVVWGADVDPRFGSGIALGQGQTSIVAPRSPLLPASPSLPATDPAAGATPGA